jgi:hypothetical protein
MLVRESETSDAAATTQEVRGGETWLRERKGDGLASEAVEDAIAACAKHELQPLCHLVDGRTFLPTTTPHHNDNR